MKCRVVVGTVAEAKEHEVVLESGEVIPFDYLLLGTGSRYSTPIADTEEISVINPLKPDEIER